MLHFYITFLYLIGQILPFKTHTEQYYDHNYNLKTMLLTNNYNKLEVNEKRQVLNDGPN